MATVSYSARSLDHIEDALKLMRDQNPEAAFAAIAAIRSAVENLSRHPLTGRRVEGELRELVISYGQTGHVALYRFVVRLDEVRVLALRQQRELGYIP